MVRDGKKGKEKDSGDKERDANKQGRVERARQKTQEKEAKRDSRESDAHLWAFLIKATHCLYTDVRMQSLRFSFHFSC